MGYACPVCEDPQADARHLANHLAFTALTGGDDHEAWLDEHVPEWERMGEDGLADEVVDVAEEAAFPQVFEESGVRERGHGHDHEHGPAGDHTHGVDAAAARERASGDLDADAREIMARARDLTRRMREERADEDGNGSGAETAPEDETE